MSSLFAAQLLVRLAGGLCFLAAIVFALILIFGRTSRRRHGCPGCGHENRSHARFCAHCGERIA